MKKVRKIVVVVCSHCGIEFQRLKKWADSNVRRKSNNYCSKQCQYTAHANKQKFNCAACGSEFYRTKSQADDTKSGDLFCSKTCANGSHNEFLSGVNHPNYKTGIGRYRKLAFEVYGKRCTVCGYDIEQVLEVHHRNKDRTNNTKENLDVLCPTHHDEFDLGFRKYESDGHSSNLIGQTALTR